MNEGVRASTLWILTAAFALAGPILSLAPLGMSPLLIATAVLAAIAQRIPRGRWPRLPWQASCISLIFLVWCGLSLIWALNPPSGIRKLLDVAVMAIALLVMFGLANRVAADQQRQLSIALVGGVLIGLVLLAVETIFDFPLYRAVMGSANPKLADLVESKRSVDALPLLAWPACLALARLDRPWLGALLALVFTVACAKLTASSATMGMALSLAVFAGSFLSVTWMRRLLALGTVLAFVLIIPFAIVAYDKGGTTAHWLKRPASRGNLAFRGREDPGTAPARLWLQRLALCAERRCRVGLPAARQAADPAASP
jgi:hypothetical protein